MRRLCVVMLCSLLLASTQEVGAAVKRWRMGDGAQAWNLTPVTGRLSWGRGWACEILADDDGDGKVDEDPVELVDNDDDGLVNEDPPEAQIDNDNDGLLNEDPVDNRDNDGDGRIDEDPVEAFDNDFDGLVNEDGPEAQIDNDGDGRISEDGRFSNLDDDYDGKQNEDPVNGLDDDGDGLVDEDPPLPAEGGTAAVTNWLSPIKLDPMRNVMYELNQRYLLGEFGGKVPGKDIQKPYMLVPSEKGYRNEIADPINAMRFSFYALVDRVSYGPMVDGNIMTAFGSSENNWSLCANLMGMFRMERVVFRPRPTLPGSTMQNYIIYYGDDTNINPAIEMIDAPKVMFPAVYGQANPSVHDDRLKEPVLAGRIDIVTLNLGYGLGRREEIAEGAFYGTGYPEDASYTSEILDLGPTTPRVRRYSREIEQFSASEASAFANEFKDVAGNPVNWGKVHWKGRRVGQGGDVRIQFRTGNSLDTHVYARRLGPGLVDTRDAAGKTLDLFTWVKLSDGRVPEKELEYNELNAGIGADGELGWSYWSAPMSFDEGLIDETQPRERWNEQGVQLPIPGGTRYLQMRVFFDNTEDSACMIDYIEFEYDAPLVSGGVLAEVFPAEVPLGEPVQFRYFLRPQFVTGEKTEFNRIEIDVPAADTRIDTLMFDGRPWVEVPGAGTAADPLAATVTKRLALTAGSTDSIGQFAQAVVVDSVTGDSKLLIKLAPFGARHFRFGEEFEISLNSRLFRGAKQFSSVVWNDQIASRATMIPQPTQAGDVTPEVATDGVLVVAKKIGKMVRSAQVAPNPFTPNGDTHNDKVHFSFDLFLVLDRVDAKLRIFDLGGHQLHEISTAANSAGKIDIEWDGRDSGGNLLPPGTYLYRLEVDSDGSDSQQTGTLAIAY